MQDNQKHRPAREILEDLAKFLGLEVVAMSFKKPGLTTSLRFRHHSSSAYISISDGNSPARRTFGGWGFDETDAADDALECILSASSFYWSVRNKNIVEVVEVDLSSINNVEELEIALDLESLKKTERRYPVSKVDTTITMLSC